jgi:hypothetical protein
LSEPKRDVSTYAFNTEITECRLFVGKPPSSANVDCAAVTSTEEANKNKIGIGTAAMATLRKNILDRLKSILKGDVI